MSTEMALNLGVEARNLGAQAQRVGPQRSDAGGRAKLQPRPVMRRCPLQLRSKGVQSVHLSLVRVGGAL